ncbi:hypothetical protein [Aquabacterium sp. CECT 9606]|uniref:hypothetical protein n=1 Tax=Aquabacterium sp. CECT 9606 TaxID=2845822 RepID=UPI001E3A61FE|nr:hypothetical protein [Aquabacterium sp. CECT 9606]CAH0356086.1 hypothetical protein AQB9606_04549 [Aquabacterium sp. CECT 9606]
MSDQFGFDFGGDHVPAYAEQPEGTWLTPSHTAPELVAVFAKVDEVLARLPEAARPLFLAGVQSAREQHALMIERECPQLAGAFQLWRSNFDVADDELRAFLALCESRKGTKAAGIEYKVREFDGISGGIYVAGMCVEGAGSVVVHKWSDDNIGIDYKPHRDSLFLTSYRDNLRRIFEPCTTWAKAHSASKFAESGDGVASVPTFAINGREYVNTGGMSHGSYRCCNAWTFVAASEWTGPTFTYRTLIQAFDKGTVERGDKRGTLVRVRGQLCVIDGAALIYDDKATDRVMPVDEDEDHADHAIEFDEEEEAQC